MARVDGFNEVAVACLCQHLKAATPRLQALDITGMSSNMKRQWGPTIVAAIHQAADFFAMVLHGTAQVDQFQLDMSLLASTVAVGKQVGGGRRLACRSRMAPASSWLHPGTAARLTTCLLEPPGQAPAWGGHLE